MSNTNVTVELSITADDYLAHYQGAAKEVVALSQEGLTVRFPSNILQRFVIHDGIKGVFMIAFDNNNKFKEIRKVG